MKRICHVNLARSFRGGERQTELLIRGLAQSGIAQRLIYRDGAPLGDRLKDVAGVELAAAGGVAGGLVSAVSASRGAGLIHAHEGRGIYVGLLRQLISNTPYIVTRRVSKPPGRGWVTKTAYRRAARIVAISAAVADGIRKIAADLDSELIPSAVSELHRDDARASALMNRFPGRFVVGHVGALDNATKGQMHLIRIAQQLWRSHPEILFVFVGSGPDEAWFKRETQTLDNVWFTGFVDNVGDYLGWFDVFAFPSQTEGLGSILLDAMHFDVPVIATRVGGVPEIVQDGKNGLLVDAGDEVRLRQAIIELYEDASLRSRLADEGRRFVEDYTPKRMVERYRKVYDLVLEHKTEMRN